jgi:CheY-like chemotaxis protein
MHRVLVCEIDESELYLITFVLTNIGWEVSSCPDCSDIVDMVKEFKPSIIMMDNDKTKNGGIHATQTLKNNKETKHIPVIFISSKHNGDSFAKEAGADYYLRKPFDIKKFEFLILQASTGKFK